MNTYVTHQFFFLTLAAMLLGVSAVVFYSPSLAVSASALVIAGREAS